MVSWKLKLWSRKTQKRNSKPITPIHRLNNFIIKSMRPSDFLSSCNIFLGHFLTFQSDKNILVRYTYPSELHTHLACLKPTVGISLMQFFWTCKHLLKMWFQVNHVSPYCVTLPCNFIRICSSCHTGQYPAVGSGLSTQAPRLVS